MALRIQIASDLHVEFYGRSSRIPHDIIVPNAPVLALLGDIGISFSETLRSFLHFQASRFETVLFLAGNHEFYNHGDASTYTILEQLEWLRSVCKERENIYFLEKDALDLHGVKILGTTLWSDIPYSSMVQAEQSMNDFQICYTGTICQQQQRLTPKETNQWHRESVQWLEQEIGTAKSRGQPVLVLTHHTPALSGTSNPKYDDSGLKCCFSSDLTQLLQSPVVAWACGHTHYNFDMTYDKGNTRLFSNQRGYPGRESANYKKDGLILEISAVTKPKAFRKISNFSGFLPAWLSS